MISYGAAFYDEENNGKLPRGVICVSLSFKTIEGNVITLRPALVITQEEIDRALGILEGALDEVERGKKY